MKKLKRKTTTKPKGKIKKSSIHPWYFVAVIVGIGILMYFLIPFNPSVVKYPSPEATPTPQSSQTTTKFQSSSEAYSKPSTSFQPKTDLEKEAYDTVVHYLDSYKNPSEKIKDSTNYQIIDYAIDSIENVHMKGNQLRFDTVFTVFVEGDPNDSYFAQGSAKVYSNNWVGHSGYAAAEKKNGVYEIGGLASYAGNDW